jgi:hypothetical protein
MTLLGAASLLALITGGCGHTKQSTGEGEDTTEVETAARTLVEVWGTFDYRDQESRYERLLPLLASETRAQWADFQIDPSAVSWQITGNTHVTAAQVDSVSEDNAVVVVSAEDSSHFIPYQSSRVVEKRVLQQVRVWLVLEDGHWLVTQWQVVSEEPLPQEEGRPSSNTPTQSAASATATAGYVADVDEAIKSLLRSRIYGAQEVKDLRVTAKYFYIDPSGADWVLFGLSPQLSATSYGIAKNPSDESWELVAGIGTNATECDLSPDVQQGLGITPCQPDATATASADIGQDVDKAIRNYCVRNGYPNITDVRIDSKNYYTDSSGTLWMRFSVFPLPEGVTDHAVGIMKRAPDGEWVGASPPGTALIQCGLPQDVQTGLGFAYCPPQPQ